MKILLLALVTISSLAAQGAVSGQEITGFEMKTGREGFELRASSEKAFISSLDQIVAARDVALVVKDGEKTLRAHCATFSHHLKHELATCEDEATRTSLTVDMRGEKVTYYSVL